MYPWPDPLTPLLHTEIKSGTSQSKSGTSFNSGNSGDPTDVTDSRAESAGNFLGGPLCACGEGSSRGEGTTWRGEGTTERGEGTIQDIER